MSKFYCSACFGKLRRAEHKVKKEGRDNTIAGFHLGFFVWGGRKNSLESLTTPTFVGTWYWHVINLSDIFSAFSIFDPIHLPDSEESLSTYGMEKLRTLTDFYGKEQTLSLTLEFQSQMWILTKQKQNGKSFVGFFSPSIDLNQGFRR